ncbi:5-methylcytosine restriction system specificity protein McrC [Tamlana crocina]|uniref:5-methylcytosine restriction system specificity protein McrC n=1 Tax=Tamlana crocina TaxID=393006 RepID=UPI003CC91BFA
MVLESRKNSEEYFIIDTKWKIVNDGKPGDDDLKQMFAYNYRWNCNHSMLLYPSTSTQNSIKGQYFVSEDNKRHSCELKFAEVLQNGKLNTKIGEQILVSFDVAR